MTYYIKHNYTGMYWNGDTWQEELSVGCVFTDYEEAKWNATANDLTDYNIIQWE